MTLQKIIRAFSSKQPNKYLHKKHYFRAYSSKNASIGALLTKRRAPFVIKTHNIILEMVF